MEKTKNSKRLVIVCISVCVVLIIGIATTFCALYFSNQNTDTNSGEQGIVFAKDAEDYNVPLANDNSAESGIKVPGYPDMTLSSESNDFPITLLNPEGNPCYFSFKLSIKETGQELYTSDLVKPGQAIKGFTMTLPLEKGSYTLLMTIETTSVETNAPMNGAEVKVKLDVI